MVSRFLLNELIVFVVDIIDVRNRITRVGRKVYENNRSERLKRMTRSKVAGSPSLAVINLH